VLLFSVRSLQYSLFPLKEGSERHPGGLLARRDAALQLHGRRPASHVAVAPALHQRFPEADPGGVRLQTDLLLPVSQPGAHSEIRSVIGELTETLKHLQYVINVDLK